MRKAGEPVPCGTVLLPGTHRGREIRPGRVATRGRSRVAWTGRAKAAGGAAGLGGGRVIELEAVLCSLDSLRAFTDEQ